MDDRVVTENTLLEDSFEKRLDLIVLKNTLVKVKSKKT